MSLTKATYSMINGAPVNILDLGAANDGTTDVASIINDYIANNVTTGDPYTGQPNTTIKVTAGTYLLDSAVLFNKGHFTLDCEGCVFIVSAGHAGFVWDDADFVHLTGKPQIVLRGDTSADIAIHMPYARRSSADVEIWYNNGVTNGLQGQNCRAVQIEAAGLDAGGGEYTVYNTVNAISKYCGWALQMLNTSTTDAASTVQANTINFSAITGGTNGLRLVGVADNYIKCQSLEDGANYGGLAGTEHILLQMQGSVNNALCSNNLIDIQYFESFVATELQTWSYDTYSIGNKIIVNDEAGNESVYVNTKNTFVNRKLGGEEYQSPKFVLNTGGGSGAASPNVNQLRLTTTMEDGVGKWAGTNATVTENNAIGPDTVGNTASTLVQTNSYGFISMGTNTTYAASLVSATQPWTFAVWLRVTTPRYVNIFMTTSTGATGQKTIDGNVYVGTTWKRYYVTGVFNAGENKSISARIRGGTSSDATVYTDLEMYGPQLNLGGMMPYEPVIGNVDMRTDMVPGLATPVDVYAGRGVFMNAYDYSDGPFRQTYGSAAPVSGTWVRGDIVWNTAPSAAGTVGWVCVTAGTPGTWKTFGTIAA